MITRIWRPLVGPIAHPAPTGVQALGRGLACLRQRWRVTAVGAIVVALMPAAGLAIPDPAGQCDRAAAVAASESGVPRPVLAALMLTESGRRRAGALRPWPWTVNMEGAGHWFDDADSAKAFAYRHFRAGARSFDVGCFQINYRWHHTAFASIEEMFDPLANARYAARFLSGLHDELGSWERAAGAYHSRTPDLAQKYQARFSRHHDAIVTDGLDIAPRPMLAAIPLSGPQEPRGNAYPLLQGGALGTMGSLVPVGIGAVRPLFAAADPQG